MPDLLPPRPGLHFYPDSHRYYLENHGWIANSVTQILAGDLDPKAKAHIEKTRHGPMGWEKRGTHVHQCLEQHLLGEAPLNPGDFADWVDPLLSSWFFKDAEVLAVEYRLCCPRKNVAGSFDGLLRTSKGSLCLFDLKTVSSAPAAKSRKPAEAQLGAYNCMLIDAFPLLTVDKCVTVVAGPGVTEVKPSDPSECMAQWLDAWDRFNLLQPDF